MKKIILISFLFATILTSAKVTVVIAYTDNEIGTKNSISIIETKFSNIYKDLDIVKSCSLSRIKKGIINANDTLIFIFQGHSNPVEDRYIKYFGNLLMWLDVGTTSIGNNDEKVLTSKTLHFLLQHSNANKILVIIDGCFPSLAYNPELYNVNWVFAADDKQVTMLYNRYSLFVHLFFKELKKGITTEAVIDKVNDGYKLKKWYPQFNKNTQVICNEDKHKIDYPLMSINISNFKF